MQKLTTKLKTNLFSFHKPSHPQTHSGHVSTPKPTKKESSVNSGDTFWKVTTVVLIVILAVFAFKGVFGTDAPTAQVVADPQPTAAAPSAPTPAPTPVVDMEKLIDDDAVKGDPDATVTIVEFSDFECPFCARFYSDTLSQIETQYIDTGKVKLVYRDFPLSFHQNAQKAAEAAECSGEQGKYYEMHDLLFERGVQGGVVSYKAYAQEIGLNTADFNSCLDSGAMASEVKKDFVDGQQAGVQGTPGFLVNGKLISGAQPFSVFQQVIEAELSS